MLSLSQTESNKQQHFISGWDELFAITKSSLWWRGSHENVPPRPPPATGRIIDQRRWLLCSNVRHCVHAKIYFPLDCPQSLLMAGIRSQTHFWKTLDSSEGHLGRRPLCGPCQNFSQEQCRSLRSSLSPSHGQDQHWLNSSPSLLQLPIFPHQHLPQWISYIINPILAFASQMT